MPSPANPTNADLAQILSDHLTPTHPTEVRAIFCSRSTEANWRKLQTQLRVGFL